MIFSRVYMVNFVTDINLIIIVFWSFWYGCCILFGHKNMIQQSLINVKLAHPLWGSFCTNNTYMSQYRSYIPIYALCRPCSNKPPWIQIYKNSNKKLQSAWGPLSNFLFLNFWVELILGILQLFLVVKVY